MRIAFISANRELLPDACIPIGLLYVMASTPEHHQKRLIDLAFAKAPEETLERELAEFGPDLVAIGIRNIQNNDYSGISTNLEMLTSLFAVVRAQTDALIIIGGAGFSVMPKELMRLLGADFGISGEGERLFPLLLNSIEKSKPIPDGVYAADNLDLDKDIVASSFVDLNQLPFPDRNLVDREYYAVYGTDSIQTSRGCPLRCSYCTYPKIEGSKRRLMSPSRVGDEFDRSAANGARHVFIVDSVFNLPPAHAKVVCQELIDRHNRMPWTCYTNPMSFDDELASLMAEAGCTGMEVGTDSGCDEVLSYLRKGFTTRDVIDLHERAQRYEIADCHTFILGTQGETIDHAKRSLEFIAELDPFAAIIMVWVDDLEALDPGYSTERQLLRDSVLKLLDDAKDAFPRWIIPSLGVTFDASMFRMMREAGLRGPLWQHMKRRRPRDRVQ